MRLPINSAEPSFPIDHSNRPERERGERKKMSKRSHSIDAALAFLVSKNIGEQRIHIPEAPKVKKAKQEKKKGEPTVKVVGPPEGFVSALTPAEFLQTIRRANTRDEKIKAIRDFQGFYDKGDAFGSQEWRAMEKAKRALINLPPVDPNVPFRRSGTVDPSVKGFVAGMPNGAEKELRNLMSREQLAIDAMVEHELKAKEATSEEEKSLLNGLARVEWARLNQIRKDRRRLEG